ncbi:MAG: hypothetical protein GF350_10335 [Chitinivibrionales bacterium]|nr:hypothetical protein [Chitinivibrionales bacterium]
MNSHSPSQRTFYFGPLPVVLFLGACFILIYFVINPALVYHWWHGFNLDFTRSLSSFLSSLAAPGGFVDYSSSLLLLSCLSRFQGSLVCTGIAFLMYPATAMLFDKTRPGLHSVIALIPSTAFLLVLSQYNWPVSTALNWSIACICASVWIRTRRLQTATSVLLFLACGGLSLYLGTASFPVYVSLCFLFALKRRRWFSGGIIFVAGYLVPAVVLYALPGKFSEALANYFSLWRISEEIVVSNAGTAAVIFSLAGACILAGIFADYFPELIRSFPYSVFPSRPSAAPLLSILLTQAMVLAPAHFIFRNDVQRGLQFDHAAYYHEWERLLDAARRLPDAGFHPYTCADVNRALYETGDLCEKMFTFPQNPAGLMVPLRHYTQKDSVHVPPLIGIRNAETCLKLGLVNLAEQMAHELLSAYSDYPALYCILAKVNIIKKQFPAARLFLKHLLTLKNDRYRRKQARRMLVALSSDSSFDNNPEIARVRKKIPSNDYIRIERWPEEQLTDLLKSNPSNRMAFEYLMAFYLQNGKVAKVAKHIDALNRFFPDRYPRHIEEALVIFVHGMNRKLPAEANPLSDNYLQKYDDFSKIIDHGRRHGLRAINAARRAAEDHLDSYFFYFSFGNVRKAL